MESDTPATSKQVAYLTYMGLPDSKSMTKQQASEAIERLIAGASPELDNWYYDRKRCWYTDRFILHPELYVSEFQAYLDSQISDAMHIYVRGRVTGAPEILTKAKIRKVIQSLTMENREWWRNLRSKEMFFDKLSLLYPSCCTEGIQPQKIKPEVRPTPKSPQLRFLHSDYRTFGEMFSHLTQYCEPWEVSFSDDHDSASPHDWLHKLDHATLSAPITKYFSNETGSMFTAEVKRLLKSFSITFRITWHVERHGWADSGPGSKAVHYFMPRSWITDPPYTAKGMLVSLCKRNWIMNHSPFYPVDSARTLCKACTILHEQWNSRAD